MDRQAQSRADYIGANIGSRGEAIVAVELYQFNRRRNRRGNQER